MSSEKLLLGLGRGRNLHFDRFIFAITIQQKAFNQSVIYIIRVFVVQEWGSMFLLFFVALKYAERVKPEHFGYIIFCS